MIKLPDNIKGISADSREIKDGFLFAAIPGVKANGVDFVPQAIENGATHILVPQGISITDRNVTLLPSDNPRADLALLAAQFYPGQPRTITAVTGTNGKSSTVSFARQIWKVLGLNSASLGTIGIDADHIKTYGSLTTPDPVSLYKAIDDLAQSGVSHLAVEASSHGIEQHRLDGLNIKAAGFTNLSRDHLDYHQTMDMYLNAKARLFTDLLHNTGIAVINADVPEFDSLKSLCKARGLTVWGYGRNAETLHLIEATPNKNGQNLKLEILGTEYDIHLPLIGEFQVGNALCALGLVLAEDQNRAGEAVNALGILQGARGRLELVGTLDNSATVYVDYAHTPDGLETVLNAIRPSTQNKLHVVVGCGGDRDKGKRPQMAAIAGRLADHVIITDDNPRTEDAASIRADMMAGYPEATEIGGREKAIKTALEQLGQNDVLIIAGKGHEQGQIVGTEVLPFDDADVARKYIGEMKE